MREKKYGQLLADALGARLVDYSNTGWTVAQSLEAYQSSPVEPSFAVIAHGVTEPIVRPRVDGLPLPRRWKRTGWMDPRPYYSRRRRRRLVERIESGIRWRLKNLLIRVRGGYQFMGLDDYISSLSSLTERLAAAGATVVIVGPPAIDDQFFPGASREMSRYAAKAATIAAARFVELRGDLDEWDDFFDDHFHPNAAGHAKIAALLVRTLWSDDD